MILHARDNALVINKSTCALANICDQKFDQIENNAETRQIVTFLMSNFIKLDLGSIASASAFITGNTKLA